MSLGIDLGLALAVILACVGIAYAIRKSGVDAQKLEEEKADAEAERQNAALIARASAARNSVRDDPVSVLGDPHNRDTKPTLHS